MKPIAVTEGAPAPLWSYESGYGTLTTAVGNLPLRRLSVDGRIFGLFYSVEVTGHFRNSLDEAIEAFYVFPLPDRCVVIDFALTIDGEFFPGVLKEREEARRVYGEAVASGRPAAMLEQERQEIFTASVGALPPGSAVEIKLELCGCLEFYRQEAVFRFPLVVAPRYLPGVTLDGQPVGQGTAYDTSDVGDASRLSPPILLPGCASPVHFDFQMLIDAAGLGFANLTSSLPDLVSSPESGRLRVQLTPGVARLDRDLILSIALTERLGSSLVHCGDAFLLTVVGPPLGPLPSLPVDLVFVLDLANAGDWVDEVLERLVAALAGGLRPHDRVGLVVVGSGEVVALGHPAQVAGQLTNLGEPRSGPLGPALGQAFGLLEERTHRSCALLLLTTGHAANETQLLDFVAAEGEGIAMHGLALGSAPNQGLLRLMCCRQRGSLTAVADLEMFEARFPSLAALLRPNLTGLEVEGHPTEAPNGRAVHGDRPSILLGRCPGGAPATMGIAAHLPDGSQASQAVRTTAISEPVLDKLWAWARLGRLEQESDSRDQLVELSLAHGVLCRYTAWVADSGRWTSQLGPVSIRVMQPVEAPPDFGAGGLFDAGDLFAESGEDLFGSNEGPSGLFEAVAGPTGRSLFDQPHEELPETSQDDSPPADSLWAGGDLFGAPVPVEAAPSARPQEAVAPAVEFEPTPEVAWASAEEPVAEQTEGEGVDWLGERVSQDLVSSAEVRSSRSEAAPAVTRGGLLKGGLAKKAAPRPSIQGEKPALGGPSRAVRKGMLAGGAGGETPERPRLLSRPSFASAEAGSPPPAPPLPGAPPPAASPQPSPSMPPTGPVEPPAEATRTESLRSTWLGAEAAAPEMVRTTSLGDAEPPGEAVDEYETGLIRRRRHETLSAPGSAPTTSSLWERLHDLGPERFRQLADLVGLYHLAAVLHAVPAALVDELAGWLGVFRGRNLKLQLNWASSLSEQELKKCEAEVEQALAQI